MNTATKAEGGGIHDKRRHTKHRHHYTKNNGSTSTSFHTGHKRIRTDIDKQRQIIAPGERKQIQQRRMNAARNQPAAFAQAHLVAMAETKVKTFDGVSSTLVTVPTVMFCKRRITFAFAINHDVANFIKINLRHSSYQQRTKSSTILLKRARTQYTISQTVCCIVSQHTNSPKKLSKKLCPHEGILIYRLNSTTRLRNDGHVKVFAQIPGLHGLGVQHNDACVKKKTPVTMKKPKRPGLAARRPTITLNFRRDENHRVIKGVVNCEQGAQTACGKRRTSKRGAILHGKNDDNKKGSLVKKRAKETEQNQTKRKRKKRKEKTQFATCDQRLLRYDRQVRCRRGRWTTGESVGLLFSSRSTVNNSKNNNNNNKAVIIRERTPITKMIIIIILKI